MYYQDSRHKLTPHEYRHYCGSYVRLTPLQHVTNERINIHGIRVRAIDAYKHNFTKGPRTFPVFRENEAPSAYTEIAIDNRVLRINLRTNCLNLIVTNDLFTPRKQKNALMLSNDELNKSIIKSRENGRQSPVSIAPNKTVSFNNTFYITPISPRHRALTPPQQNSYENTFKEYLKKMNGSEPQKNPNSDSADAQPPPPPVVEAANSQETTSAPHVADDGNNDDNEDDMEVEMLEDEPPRRGRGRPRGSGRVKQYVPRPPPRDPNTPPKRRGWPLGLPRKKFTTYKNVHRPYGEPSPTASGARRGPGRPRKIIAFGFQTIVTDIKSVNLPSELWSAHVSVTSKRSQVCFTRVVQNKSNAIPVECDRSVKFNGTVKYLVRINNRDVALVAAPPAVNSIRDIEILLNIVNDIAQNDPVLEYFNR